MNSIIPDFTLKNLVKANVKGAKKSMKLSKQLREKRLAATEAKGKRF